MKLAVSNIAWEPQAREAAYGLMGKYGFTGLEIAPGLFFSGAKDPLAPTEEEAVPRLAEVAAAGLSFVSMQSLLYGVEGAALFGNGAARESFISGMRRAIALAGRFGIPNLVFGSPRQRNVPEGMSAIEAMDIAVAVFRDLGDAAAAASTRLGIEFNPAVYGTNFLNTHTEVGAFVAAVDHPAVTMILDVGALHMNGDFDEIERIADAFAPRVSHVHLSEPNLGPSPARAEQAARVMAAMGQAGYEGWYSIEMKSPEGGLAEIDTALARLRQAASSLVDTVP